MVDSAHDIIDASIKAAPAIAGAAWSMWGFSLQELAALATITYTVLMIFFLLKDRYKKWKRERKKD